MRAADTPASAGRLQGARVRQGAPRVPGMDETDLEAAQSAAAGKGPARRRRPKKPAEADAQQPAAPARPSTDTVAAELTRLKLAEPGVAGHREGQANGATAQAPDAAEKIARGLRKKLTACEVLSSRKAAGETLTVPELDKLAKAVAWQRELDELGGSHQQTARRPAR